MKQFILGITLMMGAWAAQAQTLTLYINSTTQGCTGVAPMQCLQYKEQPTDNWQLLYAPIEGFSHEAGYIYTLRVQVKQVAHPPADGSSVRYILKKVLSKQKDDAMAEQRKLPQTAQLVTQVLLNGALENVSAKAWELTLREGKVLTKVCNRISGSYTHEGEGTIRFGPLMSTKMICPDMQYEQAITSALQSVDGYFFDGIKLNFTSGGKVVLVVSELVR